MIETLITVVIVLAIAYVIWYAISHIPMTQPWSVVVPVLYWLLVALLLLSLVADVMPLRLNL